MKYLISNTGPEYILEGILKGIKMGLSSAIKDIFNEKIEEFKERKDRNN